MVISGLTAVCESDISYDCIENDNGALMRRPKMKKENVGVCCCSKLRLLWTAEAYLVTS